MKMAHDVPKPVFYMGALGFYWFFLTSFWGRDGHHVALLLALVFFGFWAAKNWSVVSKSSLFGLSLILSAWILLRSFWGWLASPDTLATQIDFGLDFLHVSALPALVLAPWLTQERRVPRLRWAFVLVVASLFIQVYKELFVHPDGTDWATVVNSRPGFQMGPNTFGLLCGVALIGLCILGKDYVALPARSWSWWAWSRWVGIALTGAVVVVLLALGLVVSQSRASWLGTLGAFTVWIAATFFVERERHRRRRLVVVVAGVLALVAVAAWIKADTIGHRLSQHSGAINQVVTLELQDLPHNAVGLRIMVLQAGASAIAERPVHGWSPASIREIIEERVTPHFPGNFHNVPVQIAVALGLVGLVLFLAMIAVSCREMWWAAKQGRWPWMSALFWFAALVLLGIESCFDFPMYDWEYQSLVVFLAMIPIAAQLERLRTTQRHHGEQPDTESDENAAVA